MGTTRPTAEQAARRHRRRGFLLLTVGALILLAGVLIALSVQVDVRGQNPGASPPPPGGFDWSGIIAALIGAVPGTITAVTGLIIVMRSRTELPAPTPAPSQPQAPPPPSKP